MRGPAIPTEAAFALAESEGSWGTECPVNRRIQSAGAVVDEHDAFSAENGGQPDSTSGAPLLSRPLGPQWRARYGSPIQSPFAEHFSGPSISLTDELRVVMARHQATVRERPLPGHWPHVIRHSVHENGSILTAAAILRTMPVLLVAT